MAASIEAASERGEMHAAIKVKEIYAAIGAKWDGADPDMLAELMVHAFELFKVPRELAGLLHPEGEIVPFQLEFLRSLLVGVAQWARAMEIDKSKTSGTGTQRAARELYLESLRQVHMGLMHVVELPKTQAWLLKMREWTMREVIGEIS